MLEMMMVNYMCLTNAAVRLVDIAGVTRCNRSMILQPISAGFSGDEGTVGAADVRG